MPDFGFDEWLNAQLRNVPVPRDLHRRLAASRPPSDDQLDELVRDVDVPAHLERRLRRIARQRRPLPPWGRFGLAASILIAVAAGALVALQDRSERQVQIAAGVQTLLPGAAQAPDRPATRSRTAPQRSADAVPTSRQRPVTVPLDGSGRVSSPAPATLPLTRTLESLGTNLQQAFEAKQREQAALGASVATDPLPVLETFTLPAPRGVRPPSQRGYDMLFQLRHDEHPFVSPAAHRELRETVLPLTLRTASYDLAQTCLELGQRPPREEIRVEDFLAAQDYAVPPAPAGRVALHVATSPSPLGAPGLHNLQVLALGGDTPPVPRPPVRLIAVVDTSSAMQLDARWKSVERALAILARQMGPEDRLTLIGFAERPRVMAENATAANVDQLLAANVLRETHGAADIASAIQSACDAVRAVSMSGARRVVFITSGIAAFDETALERSSEPLRQLVADNIPWKIVRMAPSEEASAWSDLARRAHGRTLHVDSPAALGAALLESLHGRSQTVAQQLSLRVVFNPRVVTSYRLLGHASATLTGEVGDPLEIDLNGGQSVTGMYELWLNQNGEGDLAVVELRWRDPQTGQPRRHVQAVPRSQVSTSFARAPGWLQQGILAAHAAESLRGSYHVPKSRRLDQLVKLAAEVDGATARRPGFRSLLRLLEAANYLR